MLGNAPVAKSEYTPVGDVTEDGYGRELGRVFKTGKLDWLSQFGEVWGLAPGATSIVYVDSHDSERVTSGTILSYKDGPLMDLATVFSLAWPYGHPLVLSSYGFTANDAGPPAKALLDEIAKAEKAKGAGPTLPIMAELPADKRRATRVLMKGNFLDPGPEVSPTLPAAFGPKPEGPVDRLALARWLVDRRNPLTARVAVNRTWAVMFGAGIVETEEDFGTQGEPPSHPELLDRLAVDFMESGWDVKRLIRRIATSATYRQSSRATPEGLSKDPKNRLLARAPRVRLVAETVRDQALAFAGLLGRRVGGPSVFPVQPDGLWQAAFTGQRTWKPSAGPARHRQPWEGAREKGPGRHLPAAP